MRLVYTSLVMLFILSCTTNNSTDNVNKISNDSLFALASNYYKKGNYKNSLNCYNKLIIADSLNGEYYYKRGNCKAQLYDYIGSNNDYEKALYLGYRNIENIYFNLALNYSSIDKDSMALKYFKLALEQDTSDVEIRILIEETRNRLKKHK
jgi:tetratricopeptide (TPR) repeat protein